LVKRALLEGADIVDLEIYINSKLQKRIMEEKVAPQKHSAPEKKQSNRCPHCGSPIPPLSKTCPGCGAAVSVSTAGDRELFSLIDAMEQSLIKLKTADATEFKREKAEAESLLRKAKLFYGDNKKVQMMVLDIESNIEELTKANNKKGGVVSNLVYYCIMSFLGLLTFSTIWIGVGLVPLAGMILLYMHNNKKFIFLHIINKTTVISVKLRWFYD
jgi:hypothetical protein